MPLYKMKFTFPKWYQLTERRPQHGQWIVVILCPIGRREDEKLCEYIDERIFRFEQHDGFDVFRTRRGVDCILSPDHERDAVWCELPVQPPHMEAWGEREKFSCEDTGELELKYSDSRSVVCEENP